MRLFFALELPEALKESLGRWQREQAQALRWTQPEGLHLTLAFLGACEPERLAHLQAAGEDVAGRHRHFEMRTAGLGGFPSLRAPRVLWLGLETTPALGALAEDLRSTLHREGQSFDPKPFRAHITLARVASGTPLSGPLAPPEPMEWTVNACALMESLAGRYLPRGRWTLG